MTTVDYVLMLAILGGLSLALFVGFFGKSKEHSLRWMAVFLVIAGIGLVIALGPELAVAILGQETQGEIQEIVSQRKRSVAYVRFTTSEGTETVFIARQGIRRGGYQVGQKVPVRFWSRKPSLAVIANRQSMWQPLGIGAGFAMAPLVTAGLIFLRLARRARRELTQTDFGF